MDKPSVTRMFDLVLHIGIRGRLPSYNDVKGQEKGLTLILRSIGFRGFRFSTLHQRDECRASVYYNLLFILFCSAIIFRLSVFYNPRLIFT